MLDLFWFLSPGEGGPGGLGKFYRGKTTFKTNIFLFIYRYILETTPYNFFNLLLLKNIFKYF